MLRLSEELFKLGFERDIDQPCIFTYLKRGLVIIIVIHVDDIDWKPYKSYALIKIFEMKIV